MAKYLTPPQLAEDYGCKPAKVLGWIARGELRAGPPECFQRPGNARRAASKRSMFERFLATHRTGQ